MILTNMIHFFISDLKDCLNGEKYNHEIVGGVLERPLLVY